MARTRQEIVQSLMEQAGADPILSSVSRSMVGKELMYFGANVIYQLESMSDAVSRFQDIARADFEQLIAYAYTNDVPCDTVKPATVKITLQVEGSKVYSPFELCLQVGNLRFYNIDFVKSDQIITLYQGKLCATTSLSSDREGAVLNALNLDTNLSPAYNAWRLYTEFKSGKYQSSYIKLGANAVSDSVRVFARELQQGYLVNTDNPIFPYTEFNQSLASPDAKLYKVRTGWDKSVNVMFGDENWAQQVNQELYQYEIYWLDAGVVNFNITENNVLVISQGAKSLKQTGTEKFSVVSYTSAENNSLAYAKSFVQTKKFLQQGLVTVSQIRAYLDTVQAVNSSKINANPETNTVTVVVKPSDPLDSYFGFLEDYLTQYGNIGTTYEVYVATPLDFVVQLKALSADGALNMARARQEVQDYCSYENLSLTTPVSSVILTQRLQQAGIFDISATIVVNGEPLSPVNGQQKLSAQPRVNTIKLYNSAGVQVGFDSDGVFRQLQSAGIQLNGTSILSKVGDFWFASTPNLPSYLIRVKDGVVQAVNADRILTDPLGNPIVGKFFEYVEDYYAFYDVVNNRVLRFAVSSSFEEGDTSIFNRLTSIRAVASNPVDLTSLNLQGTVYSSGPMAIVNGYLVASVEFVVGSNTVYGVYSFILQQGNWTTSTLSLLSGSITSSNPIITRFTVQGTKVVIPTSMSTSQVLSTYSVSDLTKNAAPVEGSITGYQFEGKLLDWRVDDNLLYVLVESPTDVKSELLTFNFRFSNIQDTLQIENQVKKELVDSLGNFPVKILQVNPIWVSDKTILWKIILPEQVNLYDAMMAREFQTVGSVDYDSGIIYNVDGEVDSYFDYEVAGTIVGDKVYPNLVEVL